MEKIKIRTGFMVLMEILLQIWIVCMMFYGILGILLFLANSFSLNGSDFAAFPLLILLILAMYYIQKTLSLFRKTTKKIDAKEKDIDTLSSISSSIFQSIIGTIVYLLIMVLNVFQQTSGIEALLLILLVFILACVNFIYLNNLSYRIKNILKE